MQTPCTACKGKGSVKESRSFIVKTPPGTVAGTELTASGRGSESPSGGLNGDLHITISIKASGGWKCVGAQLKGTLEVGYSIAMLGGFVNVDLPTGKTVEVYVPPRANSGKRITLEGQGLFNAANKMRGDAVLHHAISEAHDVGLILAFHDERERFIRAVNVGVVAPIVRASVGP